jgi:hypothetical protein
VPYREEDDSYHACGGCGARAPRDEAIYTPDGELRCRACTARAAAAPLDAVSDLVPRRRPPPWLTVKLVLGVMVGGTLGSCGGCVQAIVAHPGPKGPRTTEAEFDVAVVVGGLLGAILVGALIARVSRPPPRRF